MIIPLEWLNEYVKVKKSAREIAESFTVLGLMLDKPIQKFKKEGYNTEVLDLEHRMDRSDWLSIIGCARDLAAFEGLELKLPPLYSQPGLTPKPEQVVKIEVKCPEMVNRFNTRVFRNIKVKPSPNWLKHRLESYGIPSINNIVDITNYVMVECGQPMHAQDLAKMEAQEIVIRKARDGESVTTLLGENIKLTAEQFVLTQAGKATVIGGIVGGNITGVDQNTKDIVLDAGNYDQNNIRRSSRSLKILNETVLRYDKYLHPELTQYALERATYLILELAGGDYYENVDWYPKKQKEEVLKFRLSRLEKISGMKINVLRIKEILQALDYKIVSENDGVFELIVPYFRTDVLVEDDIAADILRINNYNLIPLKIIQTSPPQEITPQIYTFEEKIRDIMVSLGLHEHITDPLIAKKENVPDQIVLENALSSEKNALRTTIRSTLEATLRNYQKYGYTDIGLFEIGKIYLLKGEAKKYSSYQEERILQVINVNTKSNTRENAKKTKQILSSLMQNLAITKYECITSNNNTVIEISGEGVGELEISGFSLATEKLLKQAGIPHRVIAEFPNYTTEKLSLLIDLDKPFGPIYQEIVSFHKDVVSAEVEEEYRGEMIDGHKKAVLVRVVYATSQTEKIRHDLIKTLKAKYGVEHRE